MESDPAPGGSAGVIVLDPETVENLDGSVVETNRQSQPVLVGRVAKERPGRLVEPHEIGKPIELGESISEGVEGGSVIHKWILLALMIA
jgi:hypothetical protein